MRLRSMASRLCRFRQAWIVIAWIFYIQNPALPARVGESLRGVYELLWHKYYIDELYNLFVTRPLFWLSTIVLSRTIDRGIIDGAVNGTGLAVEESGEGVRRAETGNLQHYAFAYLLGVVAIAAYYVYLVIR
jgi:NADH-quinone oxidoreductase subunit L